MKNQFKFLIIFFNLFFIASPLNCTHKIIYLISPPRSLSVAFMRMMQARGDFTIFHEPSQKASSKFFDPEFAKKYFYNDALDSFETVKKLISKEAKSKNVFVKEISSAIDKFILEDCEFVRSPNIYFVMLLRSPHDALLSLYNKLKPVHPSFEHLTGYKAAYDILQKLKNEAVHEPCIISTEDLFNDPEGTIKKFCSKVKIEYIDHALQWENLGEDFDGIKDWHEIKRQKAVQHWHGDAITSTGFTKPRTYKVDQCEKPTFEEIENEEHKKICINIYQENLKYYELMLGDEKYWL